MQRLKTIKYELNTTEKLLQESLFPIPIVVLIFEQVEAAETNCKKKVK